MVILELEQLEIIRKVEMTNYRLPQLKQIEPVPADTAVLVASGDLRISANQNCWVAQEEMENKLHAAKAAFLHRIGVNVHLCGISI